MTGSSAIAIRWQSRAPQPVHDRICLITGGFTDKDCSRTLAALEEAEMNPSQPPAIIKRWLEKEA